MFPHLSLSHHWVRCLAVTGFVLVSAFSAVAAEPADTQQFQQDMRSCRDADAPQSRSDCERETRNARAEARRGGLTTPTATPMQQAQRRCEVFQREGDRADCMARMGSGAQLSGSVNGGGLMREATPPEPER